jgi:hypothetical protein
MSYLKRIGLNKINEPITKTLKLYKPHQVQLNFHRSTKRFRIAVLGRQSGKSTMCNNELLKKAWESPNTKYGYISPIFSQSREQYRRLIKFIPPEIIFKKSDTELRVELLNKSTIDYLSGDNPDSLRGRTYHGVIIDEAKDQDPNLWQMVVRPMLTTTLGWCAIVGTPAGFDMLYDLSQAAIAEPEYWDFFQSPSTCNPKFTQAEFEAAKKEMSEPVFAQEILAEFRDITSGKAYIAHTNKNQAKVNPFSFDGASLSPYLPLLIGCDFNVGSLAWVIGQERMGDFYFLDEVYIENTNTQEGAFELIERIKSLAPNGHKAGIVVIGDATGNANKTSASGQTDYSILMKALTDAFGNLGVRNDTPQSNPPVKDRVNLVNGRLQSADGTNHLWYHPDRCKMLKRDFERVVWKSGTSAILDQTKDPKLTHASDACGYIVHRIMSQTGVGTLRIVAR